MGTQKQIKEAWATAQIVGQQMSNLCFNLAQTDEPVSPRNKDIMQQLVRDWDEAARQMKAAVNAKRATKARVRDE